MACWSQGTGSWDNILLSKHFVKYKFKNYNPFFFPNKTYKVSSTGKQALNYAFIIGKRCIQGISNSLSDIKGYLEK